MKTITKTLLASTLVAVACVTAVIAQDAGNTAERPERAPRRSPVITALDANQDGVLDAAEIANASKALLALDANQDGQLTVEELRPAHAGAGRGPAGAGRGGPRGGKGPRHGAPAAE